MVMLLPLQVEPYQQGVRCSLGAIKKSKRLEVVLQEAEIFLPLSNEERLKKCEYRKSALFKLHQQSGMCIKVTVNCTCSIRLMQ